MQSSLISLNDFRLPGYPSAPLTLNGRPLSIFAENISDLSSPDDKLSTIAIGIATILYKWHPNALAAFLDLDPWFSLTWSCTLASGTKFEIGRVRNRVTFGTLDVDGEKWEFMLTFDIVSQGQNRGEWVVNTHESMIGEKDIANDEETKRLAEEWVRGLVAEQGWEAVKGVKHGFWVEYAPMDIFGDGIPICPDWLYHSVDLARCTTCKRKRDNEHKLGICARCGTAAYCTGSTICQKSDWKVHKWICTMSVEDRGQALKVSEKGGLIRWDRSHTMVEEGKEVQSENPHFAEPQLVRTR
jgi:hypothetical protein